jgi:hypothetical protein
MDKELLKSIRDRLDQLKRIGLLCEMLRYAYGGYREEYRGRPFPMDN